MPEEAAFGQPPSDRGPAPGSIRGWTLGLVCVAMFMLMLDLTVVNVALQSIRVSLDASFSDLQWVLDSYTLTLAAFLLTGGTLADRLGRKRLFLAGLAVFTLASLAGGLAQHILELNLARGVQGVGAALMFAVGPALIGNEFHGKDRAKAFGLFGAITGLALAFGPLIGGVVTSSLSWRWIFLLNVPIGVLAATAGMLRLRESKSPAQHRVDWPGMVLFAAALASLVFGFLRGESSGWTSAPILGAFIGGVLLLAAFVLVEYRRGPAALLDLSLLRNPTFAGVCAATLLSNATSLAAIFLQIDYVENVLGYGPQATGLRFLPMTLTLFVVAAVSGGALAKVPPGRVIGTSIALIGIGMGLFRLVGADSGWTVMLPSLIVTGIGMGLFNPPRAAVTIGVVAPEKAGMASGMGETFQQVGVAVGIAGFGALFQNRVVSSFAGSPSGAALGAGQAHSLGRAVATSGVSAVTGRGDAASGLVGAARTAFVGSLDSVMLWCCGVAIVGAVIAFVLIRTRDLHASAQIDADGASAAAAVSA
jgi:EmrB/QacA subfamily drug resistance transporter